MAWNKALKAWASEGPKKAARRRGGRRDGWLIVSTTWRGETHSRFYFTDELGHRKTEKKLERLRLR
jgi:hypothetical protein